MCTRVCVCTYIRIRSDAERFRNLANRSRCDRGDFSWLEARGKIKFRVKLQNGAAAECKHPVLMLSKVN